MTQGLDLLLPAGIAGLLVGILLPIMLRKLKAFLSALWGRVRGMGKGERYIFVAPNPSLEEVMEGLDLLITKINKSSFQPHIVISFDPGGSVIAGMLLSKFSEPVLSYHVNDTGHEDGARPNIDSLPDLQKRDRANILIVTDVARDPVYLEYVAQFFVSHYTRGVVKRLALAQVSKPKRLAGEAIPKALDFVALQVRGSSIEMPWDGTRSSSRRGNSGVSSNNLSKIEPRIGKEDSFDATLSVQNIGSNESAPALMSLREFNEQRLQ